MKYTFDKRCLRDTSFGRSTAFEMDKTWNLNMFEEETLKIAEEINMQIDKDVGHVMMIDFSYPFGKFRVPNTYDNVDMTKILSKKSMRICFEI